jgi:hypothetical protein
MEAHDYLDGSCRKHVDSLEVFFDATDPGVIAFVDQLIEGRGRADCSVTRPVKR